VGAHLSKRVDIPAKDAGRIVDAVSFLRSVASGERPVIGRRVAVYGGGNTAMDAARVARRLGANDALIVYRRTRAQMPAHEEEAEEAEREGVRINWLRTITAFDGPELTIEAMELDEHGFPQPTGRFETLAADTVILALGQETDTAFLRQVPGVEFSRDGTVQVSASMMTGCPGVFAGGDMVPSERTVTVGVGHGKKAAKNIDAYKQFSAKAGAIWKEHGALEYIECVADDVKAGKVTSFPQAVKLEADEVVVFSWIVYQSREDRDRINAAVMSDSRLKMDPQDMPFDGKRLFWGGFKVLLAL